MKRQSKVTYLGCLLDEAMKVEPVELKVIKKINGKLKFLYRKNRYLTKQFCRILYNALIQQHFDYACPAWHPYLNEKTKRKIQIIQNKFIRFSFQLDKMHHITEEQFRLINRVPTIKRVDQCVSPITYNYVNSTCPYYINEIFEFTPHCWIDTRNNFSKLVFKQLA